MYVMCMCSIDDDDCYVESMCVCMLSVLLFISLVLPAANMVGGLDY